MLAVHSAPTLVQAQVVLPSGSVQGTIFDSVQFAIEPFTRSVIELYGGTTRNVRLHVGLPSWSPTIDLTIEEVHALHANALKSVHSIVNTLRGNGMASSYQIMVASSAQVLIRALPPHQKLLQSDDLLFGLEIPKTLGRGQAVVFASGPVLIIS